MAETTKIETPKKVEESKGQPYSFPGTATTIYAGSYTEALEIYNKTKESDNG